MRRKILSAYEPEIDVIVRGKADREVEFGNTLYLCESAEGYLLDWKLYGGQAPSELKQLWESLERQKGFALEEKIEAISGIGAMPRRRPASGSRQRGFLTPLRPAIHKSSRSGWRSRALSGCSDDEGAPKAGSECSRTDGTGARYAAKALTTVTLAWPGRFCPTIYGKSRRDLRKNMRKRQRRRHRDPRIESEALPWENYRLKARGRVLERCITDKR